MWSISLILPHIGSRCTDGRLWTLSSMTISYIRLLLHCTCTAWRRGEFQWLIKDLFGANLGQCYLCVTDDVQLQPLSSSKGSKGSRQASRRLAPQTTLHRHRASVDTRPHLRQGAILRCVTTPRHHCPPVWPNWGGPCLAKIHLHLGEPWNLLSREQSSTKLEED